ncbi:MAG: bi-domain-containing oxidoreductase [Anaerolineales bacterium]|nr:bi-domain-containing oxidoreductase [Anaerolineales bacterium]
MKQVVQDLRSGKTLVIDVPVPAVQPGMALVKTHASLVSAGTERMLVSFAGKGLVGKARARPDLVRQVVDKARREGVVSAIRAVRGRMAQPLALGYASAGVIVEVSPELAGFRRGDRVACAGGGYAAHAEYAVVPRNLLAHLPDAVDFECGAFATLGAIAMHGFRLAEAQVGERVAVVGMGLLGVLATGIAGGAGCPVLGIDLAPERVRRARSLGLQVVERSRAEREGAAFSKGEGFDIVLICADTESGDPVELAGRLARDRGRVIAIGAVGLELPRRLYYEKELSFQVSRSYGPGRYDPAYEEGGADYPAGYVRWTEGRNLQAVLSMIDQGLLNVRPLITHRIPIAQAPQAYSLISGKQPAPFLGVVLTYPEPEPGSKAPSLRLVMRHPRPSAPADIRLGVLGAGSFAASTFLPAIRGVAGVQRVGIASAAGRRAADCARRFGFGYATSHEAEILQDPEINTVAVLTRHHLHAAQAAAALRAGKHVWCEKPLAVRPEEMEEVLQALASAQGMLMVGFNRRFAPLVDRLRQALGDRREPMHLSYRVYPGRLPLTHWLHDPDQGGGRILGEGCHFVDLMTYLVGSLPVRVHAVGMADDARYRDDNVAISLTFADGSVGTLSYLAAGATEAGKERLEVSSGGRTAVLDDFRSLAIFGDGRNRAWRDRWEQDKGHARAWAAFVQAIREGGPPPIPYGDLFAVAQACLAAVQSLRSGTPVAVDVPGAG